jgi:broad specificity phosphatase PhoE
LAIYLVRHGKDEDGFRGGWSQRGLIDEGIKQSKQLGEYLKTRNEEFNINRVISSDLRRALETAKEIAERLGLMVQESEHWREINNGFLAGMPNDEANEKYTGLYFNSLRMDEEYPGGESPIENFNRIKQTFEQICFEQLNTNDPGNVLIVTHGGVINIIYHIVKGIEWTNKNKSFPVANTSIHKIEFVEDKWEITKENLTEHLNNKSAY